MESRYGKTIEIALNMNETEAVWLRNVMQNPLHGQSAESEDQDDRAMRKMFWNTLKYILDPLEEGIEV